MAVLASPSAPEPVARFVGPGFVAAFLAVTVAGFAQAAITPGALPRGGVALLAPVAVLHALTGTLVLHAAERRSERGWIHAVVGVLAGLGTIATLASRGHASMLLLAVVAVAVLHLQPRTSLAVTIGASLVALIAFARRDPLWTALLQAEIGFGSGIAFVFVFSRIARREQQARGDRERLARAEERNRIAREIHDGLGHYLTVVHIQLEAARSYLTADPERAGAALARAQQLTHEGLGEVRRSVGLLRGAAVRRPLLDALGALVDASTAAGVATRLCVEGAPRRLAEPVEFALIRAAQEALTNVRRHAGASGAAVTVGFCEPACVRLRVEDDGVGASEPGGGFGLAGMRERAALVGGRLAIETAPGRGFALELEVPG